MYLLLTMVKEKVKKYFPCPGYETYRGSLGVGPTILSVGNRWKCLNFTSWSLHLRKKTQISIE
jgi:hypothetical protein